VTPLIGLFESIKWAGTAAEVEGKDGKGQRIHLGMREMRTQGDIQIPRTFHEQIERGLLRRESAKDKMEKCLVEDMSR
jgi:hypothetical protein